MPLAYGQAKREVKIPQTRGGIVIKKKKQKKKKVSENGLNGLKEEIAKELGLEDDIARRGWANLTSRETGKIGGHMAQKLKKDIKKDKDKN